MIIKQPPAYDTSYYEIIPDFAKVSPRPLVVSTKATEGGSIRDPKFLTYWADLKQDGIRRMCYHFHRKAVHEAAQATNFINTVKAGGVVASDILELDIEEGGETATQIIAWLDLVEYAFPNNRIMIYSRKNILDPIPMTTAQATRLKQYKIWTAGYPNNPDLFSAPPLDYIPNPARWGEVWMWQYTESAVIQGITGEVDANWLASAFITLLGGSTPPTPEPADDISTPHPGMTRISGKREGWHFELFKLDRTRFEFEVVHCNPPETPSSVAKRKNATLVFPAGDYDRFTFAIQDLCISNSIIVRERVAGAGRPSLMLHADDTFTIETQGMPMGVKQAFTGIRPLIQNGIIDPKLSDTTQAQNTEGHARFMFTLDAQGNPILMVSEGAYPNQGLTLLEGIRIPQKYGAETGGDGGGGGDVACVLDGIELIKPENIDPQTGLHFERALPVVFCVYAKDETMTTRYEAIAINDGTRLRPDHNTNNTYTGSYIKGTKFHGDNTFVASVQLKNAGGVVIQNVGDTWLQVTEVNGVAVAGWVAVTNMGIPITTLTDNGATPPPATDEIATFEINLTAKTVTTTLPTGWTGTTK